MIFVWKWIGNDFLNKNAFQITFSIKMHSKWFLNKNELEMIFWIKIYSKGFFEKIPGQMIFRIKNSSEMIFLHSLNVKNNSISNNSV